MSVKLIAGRSGALFDHGAVPEGAAETVEAGPFEYVELTYEHLRVGPDGDHIGGFKDGYWWLDGYEHPFSDLDVVAAEGVAS